ncbi:MAG: elongation factor G [Myxococcaceae bacterium]|nr:elongation factor G [Myxococcaceae bacterium]
MHRESVMLKLRNIGIIAHVDAGKTTLSERILYFSGRIHRRGEVHRGDTTLDWTPEERKHGITITAAATTIPWAGHQVQLIDTPGHIDFSVEVERSLRVLDGAVVVLDAGNGVEPQTETVWRRADALGVPRLVFVNKMDRVGASFEACLHDLEHKLGATPLALQVPLENGHVDLLRRKAVTFDADGAFSEGPMPADLEPRRRALVEQLAEVDDNIAEALITGAEATAEALELAVRHATRARVLVPVLCGSAYKNRGVQQLLDAVVAYLPEPSEGDGSFTGLVFKLMVHRQQGTLGYVRVYSGELCAGSTVLNARTGEKVRIGRVLKVHADKGVEVERVGPGGLCAVTGLHDAKTGDTLCDPAKPVKLEEMSFAEPLVELALESKRRDDRQTLADALKRMTDEDPTLKVSTEAETGRVVLRGMGELHLQIVLERLEHQGLELKASAPSVAYRETVRRTSRTTYRLKKQSGGPGMFAVVTLEVSPLQRDEGFRFVDLTRGGSVPKEYASGVEKGVRGALTRGPLGGHPVVDVEVRLIDGETHPKDSSAMAFEIAGSLALQEALRAAAPALLEPVMAVEVVVPEDFVGAVLADLGGRRGQVQGMAQKAATKVISAFVPLAELFGHVASLRSRSTGRGSVTMRHARYDFAPMRS